MEKNRPFMYYSNELKKHYKNPKKYHQLLEQFIQTYKVNLCTEKQQHNLQSCFNYHNLTDRRRIPKINHQIKHVNYDKFCECNYNQCKSVHNQYQHYYNPLIYKINLCQNINCELGFYCYNLHQQQIAIFQYGQFFRFDLPKFKTQKCYKKIQHQRKTCLYYHNDKDRRRTWQQIKYNHVVCSNNQCNNQKCQFSHNKLQQLYHPTRYKTKFCQFYPHSIQKCDYKSFCSFAHTETQITANIQLINLLQTDPNFYVYKYKTVWCPYTMNHQRDKCVYAHNFQDYRRDPKMYQYEPVKCQNWKFGDEVKSIEAGGCKAQMNCKKCHGWMEHRYHPVIYNSNSKRNKSKSIKKQETIEEAQNIIKKKLTDLNIANDYNKNKGRNLGLQKNNFSKGTPFFKNDKYQQISVKTKAQTQTNKIQAQSDKSIDASSNKDPTKTSKNIVAQKMVPLGSDLDRVWAIQQNFFQQNKQEGQSSSRSKSARKSQQYCGTYSQSIKNALEDGDGQILKKLRRQKYNQIQIVNMDSNKIDKLSFLTAQQRQRLTKQLQIYNMKHTYSVSYSKQLTRYFIAKKKDAILQKMQQKKVKQAKLLKLVPKQISQLSFLQTQQKSALPKLLKEFKNQKQFKQLDKRIQEETKMK